MLYTKEFNIDEFPFWSGAKDRMDNATDEQKNQVNERLDEFFEGNDHILCDAEINDFVWFECDDIFYPEEDED